MGPCEEALSFLDGNLHKIHHYPALDQEPYRSELRSWLGLPHDYLLMGNGSSELIDLSFGWLPRDLTQWGPMRSSTRSTRTLVIGTTGSWHLIPKAHRFTCL